MSTSSQFDPYYKWLGIPPDEQPPNYYRLLGIPLFESDAAVINNAADGRMVQLRTYQMGPQRVASQRLLNEVAAARACLLDAEQRAEYDQLLAQDTFGAPPVATPTPPPVVAPPTTAESRPDSAERARQWAIPTVLGILLAAGLGVVIAVIALLLLVPGRPQPVRPANRQIARQSSQTVASTSDASATSRPPVRDTRNPVDDQPSRTDATEHAAETASEPAPQHGEPSAESDPGADKAQAGGTAEHSAPSAAGVKRHPEPGDYAIQFHRPWKIGDSSKVFIQARARLTSETTVDLGRPTKSVDDWSVNFEAVMSVDLVDDTGRITRGLFQFLAFNGALQSELVTLNGRAVIAELVDGTMHFKPQTGTLTKEQMKLLSLAIKFPTAGTDEDDVFGSVPTRLGSHWQVNRDALAKALAAEKITIAPGGVESNMTCGMASLKPEFARLLVSGSASAKVTRLGSSLLPEDVELTRASISMQIHAVLPIDLSIRSPETTHSLSLTTEGVKAGPARFKSHYEYSRTVRYLPPGDSVHAPSPDPVHPPVPTTDAPETIVRLPEPYSGLTVAGGGKYLVCHLPQARQLAIVDVTKKSIVRRINDIPEDVMLCGGAEKLLLVVPSQRMIQRWDLESCERERVGAIPGAAPRVALLGNSSDGPLLLWAEGPAQLIDIDTLRPLQVSGDVLQGQPRYPLRIDVSADGKTFGAIVTGLSSQRYWVMRVRGRQLELSELTESTSHTNRWACPSADGSLLLLPNGRIYSPAGLVSAEWLEGSTCYPTPDPSYFIAVRFVGASALATQATHMEVCSSADRRVLYTVKGLLEMAPNGNDNARSEVRRRILFGEPRFYCFPQQQRIVTLPYDNTRIYIRELNLDEVLKDALIVVSATPAAVQRGRTLNYLIRLRGDPEDLTFGLESGPPGVNLEAGGRVRWRVPRSFTQERAAIIVSIRNSKGSEILHTVDLSVE